MVKNENFLGVSTCYKNDPWHIIEFIEYHLLVGVRKFYIFNNDFNPKKANRILYPYVQQGLVANIHSAGWFNGPKENKQQKCHTHALRMAKGKCKWLAMLDFDEFIYPVQHDNLIEPLKTLSHLRQVAFNYACFGSAGLRYRPVLQTESYNRRARFNWAWNRLCKSIGQVNKVHYAMHHHHFDGLILDERGKMCGWIKPYKANLLRINHYMARSKEDFEIKMRRGNPFGEKRDWGWFNWADRNEVLDNGMMRFVPEMKENIKKRWKNFLRSKRKVAFE
jgi:hypothetical protein